MIQEEKKQVKTVQIVAESDIVKVRKTVRQATNEIGFGLTDITRIVTASSELARNVCRFAEKGSVHYRVITKNKAKGIELVFQDKGPGIADVNLAMSEGYSSIKSMGLGLPGTKRLMDEMEIESKVDSGTKITIRKWTR